MGPEVGGFTGLSGAEITSYCVNEKERIMVCKAEIKLNLEVCVGGDYNFYCLLQNVEVEEEHVDDRSVDDLLLFMDVLLFSDSKGVKPTKNKKKNRRRKNNPKEPSSDIKNGNHKKVGS